MKPSFILEIASVLEALPNANFKLKLNTGKEIRGYLSGRMRKNNIKVLPGDNVLIELRPDILIANQVARITRRK